MPNLLNDKLKTLDESQVAKLYKNVFDSEEGQLVLEDLRNRCYCKVSTKSHPDGIDLGEGMRTVVLHIENQINYEVKETESEE